MIASGVGECDLNPWSSVHPGIAARQEYGVSAWWHEGIGIAAFVLSAVITLWLLGRMRERELRPCTT